MTKETYIKMLNNVRASRWLYAFVRYGGKLLTYVSYIVYPLLVAWLFWRSHETGTGVMTAWSAVIVPGVSFILLSIYRSKVNAPRPYEVFETPSLVPKKTRGNSFPSRHVFSAFIIATTAAFSTVDTWLFAWLAIALYACSVLLAVTRVLSGVHFPKDVVAGAATGILMGVVGFMIL